MDAGSGSDEFKGGGCVKTVLAMIPKETQTLGVQTNPQPGVRFELALHERMVVSQCSPCTQHASSLLFLLEVCMPSMAIYFKGFDKGLRIDEIALHPSQSSQRVVIN